MAKLACGKCKVPLEGPSEPKSEDAVTCPRCGQSDTLERAMAEANEFLQDQVLDRLDRSISEATRNSKSLSYKPSRRVKREFGFIYIDD